ncbi:hypothetical protein FKM82_031099 [Ascaphus truei]
MQAWSKVWVTPNGVIKEFGVVREHLNLVASHIFKEFEMACSGVRILDRLFLGNQIRFCNSMGVQHSFSNATHLRRFGSACHC